MYLINKKKHPFNKYILIGVCVAVIVITTISVNYKKEDVKSDAQTLEMSIAKKAGVPDEPFIKLATYLHKGGFNTLYGGEGLYCVKPDLDLSVIKNELYEFGCSDKDIESKDDIYNISCACAVLLRIYQRTNDWEETFCLYVFGEKESAQLIQYCF